MIPCGEARQKGGRFARENGLRRPKLSFSARVRNAVADPVYVTDCAQQQRGASALGSGGAFPLRAYTYTRVDQRAPPAFA